MWWSPFKVKLPKNLKNSYFPKRALHVSLPFGLRVTFIFPQEYRKFWISVGSFLWHLKILITITCLKATKHVIKISLLWSKSYFLPLFKINFSIHRSSPPEVFLGKGVLKICCKFTGEQPCRSAISINLAASEFKEIWETFHIARAI